MKAVRLLVVDDSAVSRRMVAKLLRQNFKDVSEASDGVEALQMFAASCSSNDPFGVIMLDNQMPNMDGPDCASELRRLGFSGTLIGLTGYGDRDQLDEFMKHGVDNVITKPLNHQRFLRILSSTLSTSLFLAIISYLHLGVGKHKQLKKRPSKISILIPSVADGELYQDENS
jgi:CheY-like chemotaxis protein